MTPSLKTHTNGIAPVLKNIVSFVFLSLYTFVSFSQNNAEPVYRKYTVDDGLPSSTIYHVLQDSKGYIWFATANGVSRYNGYKFENFDLQSGLVDNEVFEIYEDYKHRIWFIPMSGKLSYFENDKIVSYKYNNKIKDHLPTSRGPVKCSFYVDSLDYIYLSLKQYGLISISPEGIYKRFEENNLTINLIAREIAKNKILISCPNGPLSDDIIINGLYQNYTTSLTNISKIKGSTQHHVFFIPNKDSSITFSLLENIYKIKGGKIIGKREFQIGTIWMSNDNEGNLWVAPQEGGVYFFENGDISKEPKYIFFKDIQISSVLQDYENAYWFSTLEDGVIYCPNINAIKYTKPSGLASNRVNALAVVRNRVYIGYEFGFFDILENENIKQYKSSSLIIPNTTIRSFFVDQKKKRIWICALDNLYYTQNDILFTVPATPSLSNIHAKRIIMDHNGNYWIATTRGLVEYNGLICNYESYINKDFTGVIYDLVEDYNGDIWFCTINGLWKYSKKVYQYINDNPLLNQTLNCILLNPIDSSLWLGSNGNGIIVKGKNKLYQITSNNGLASNSITQLYQSNNEIWAATPNGLSRITINKNKDYVIQNLTYANGLPTNMTTSVCEYNNIVYVGTTKGLTVFDKNKIIDDKTPPKILIESFKGDNTSIDFKTKLIKLSYQQNNLNFNFIGFAYRNEGKINYRYHIIGIDSSWVYSQTPNCFYSGLTDGSYRFEVEAQSYNGVWSSAPATISFTITPPFWKRGWFIFVIVTVFSILILLVFKMRITSIKKRNDLIQNINLYKQQSLRQQMNPHFIFNTLNSIQLYILEKDAISSHKYLTKFARLMRMTLENSQNPTIPIRDEIEALTLYLDLEKLRFEGKFDYIIDYGQNESLLSYQIPTLLIQPFVENAIWHGISLKQNQIGIIKIAITENLNSLICTIEDNGIGRTQADLIKKKSFSEHKSKGSMITQQRIDLLSTLYKEKFKIDYEDLYDSLGIPCGTRVYVTIPKNITMNIQQ